MGPKEARVAIHISDEIQLQTKATQEKEEGTSFLIKATISWDNTKHTWCNSGSPDFTKKHNAEIKGRLIPAQY